MTLILFTIPDAPGELPAWLERRLVSLDLPRLVDELTAVHAPPPHASLQQLLGAHLTPIAHAGLGSVPPEVIRQLLRQPRLLLELHEHVILQGGPYWEDLLAGPRALEDRVERGRRHVESLAPGRLRLASRRADRRAWFGVALALAAGIMLLAGVWWQWKPATPPGWGWDRPGALAVNRPAPEYLNGLADGASEWFNQRPASAPELAKRLHELRAGCTTLILASHPALNKKDRDWLCDSCRKWAARLDGHLADLEAGTKSVEAVRGEADETVNRLVNTLRTRAGQVF